MWIKPHLSPLYAWSAATASGTVGKLPQTVILTMLYLRRQLASVSFMVSAKRPIYTTGEIFRTDAKCEDGRVVLAGWEVCDDSLKAKWFRVALSPDDFQGGQSTMGVNLGRASSVFCGPVCFWAHF